MARTHARTWWSLLGKYHRNVLFLSIEQKVRVHTVCGVKQEERNLRLYNAAPIHHQESFLPSLWFALVAAFLSVHHLAKATTKKVVRSNKQKNEKGVRGLFSYTAHTHTKAKSFYSLCGEEDAPRRKEEPQSARFTDSGEPICCSYHRSSAAAKSVPSTFRASRGSQP